MLAGPALARFAAALQRCGVCPGDRLAVALSGGPDSMALAAMTVGWQRVSCPSQEPPLALVVDHKLRPESSQEATEVAAQARRMGLASRVLAVSWPGGVPPPRGDKMAAAREARYSLMLAACTQEGRRRLLLAHHADDQAETFLLRLLHASGVAGLACMPAAAERQTELGPVTLVRPLLDFRKAELEVFCQQDGLPFVVDPTNANFAFQRNHIRHLLYKHVTEVSSSSSKGTGLLAASCVPSTSAGGNGGGSSSSLVEDILLLQRRCEAVTRWQEAQAELLLRSAVLHTSCVGLPERQLQTTQQQEQQHQTAQQAEQPWQQAEQPRQQDAQLPPAQQQQQDASVEGQRRKTQHQRWLAAWQGQLAEVAAALHHMRFALLDITCLNGQSEPVTLAALSRALQAVSGRPYPPGLAQVSRLLHMLLPGRLGGAFTGGGCLVRPLPSSKGRYALCVAQADWEQAAGVLERLHSSQRTRLKGKQYSS